MHAFYSHAFIPAQRSPGTSDTTEFSILDVAGLDANRALGNLG
jgi:hypothetical protein